VRTASGATLAADQALRQPEVTLRTLLDNGDVVLETGRMHCCELPSVETAIKFEGYLRRQQEAVDRARRNEDRPIPDGFPFASVPGLSREMVQRFEQVRPETLGQALRIPGSTPAAVAVLGAYVQRLSS
jgi:tRNA uridine 5-carboxymethylaminomethyl modification enzyme